MPQLFLDHKNYRKLKILLSRIPAEVKEISAAVAYNTNDILIKKCIEKNINLEFWGLFNSGLSTDIEIIKKALNSTYITFYPFVEHFHSKIIYFHGYGVFIGSHNLTRAALEDNVECGVFIPEEELTDEHKIQLRSFFDYLRSTSKKLVPEDLDRLIAYEEAVKEKKAELSRVSNELKDLYNEKFADLRTLKNGLQHDDPSENTKTQDEKLIKFSQEWRDTQSTLGKIRKILESKDLPSWVNKNASMAVVLDQMLYFYKLDCLSDRDDEHIIESYFQKNKNNHDQAINTLVENWINNDNPSSECIKRVNYWSIENYNLLQKLKERYLTHEEFIKVFTQNNALIWSCGHFPNEDLKQPKGSYIPESVKTPMIADFLYQQKSKEGIPFQDVLKYLLFNSNDPLETRLYNVLNLPKYKIKHFGPSIAGETLGWGRPDITQLRNESTNKALRCLGFNVKYSGSERT